MTLRKLCEVADFSAEGKQTFKIASKDIVIFYINDIYYAIDQKCSHKGANLAKGTLKDNTIKCTAHDAVFNLATGDVIQQPNGFIGKQKKIEKLATYKVEKRDNALFIDI